ncbi:MAG: response regulator transcription factor [Campylobacterota bacterium]|nr:response regulator transcription factor [Campylobacterota bacterium]
MTKNLKVLYVEDDIIIRKNMAEILTQYFTTVITASDGKEALSLYEENSFDVAILDISIPKISGLHVARKIREKDSAIEIIMLSAFADQEKLLTAANLQIFAYLVKPVKIDNIDETLKKLLQKFEIKAIIELGNNFSWNEERAELFHKDIQIKITASEKAIIELLLLNKHMYINACKIAEEIMYPNTKDGDTECNPIVQIISRFKKKTMLNIKEGEFFITNSYGAGYKIL